MGNFPCQASGLYFLGLQEVFSLFVGRTGLVILKNSLHDTLLKVQNIILAANLMCFSHLSMSFIQYMFLSVIWTWFLSHSLWHYTSVTQLTSLELLLITLQQMRSDSSSACFFWHYTLSSPVAELFILSLVALLLLLYISLYCLASLF